MATTLSGATPAHAAYSIAFSPTGGAVGTPITLSSTVSSGASGVGIGTVTYFAGGKAVASAKVDSVGAVAPATWTPMAAGSVALYAAYASNDGTTAATSATSTVTIEKAATTTELTMPTTAKVGATVTITATVQAGSYVPTGSVTFMLPKSVVLTAATLDAKGKATISVKMPDTASTYELTAMYNADANAKVSTSKTTTTLVTETGSNVALSISTTTLAIGVPATLTAAITPATSSGTVTFSVGSTLLGAATIANGKATLVWRPSTAGDLTLAASFIPKGENKPTGSDTLKVTVARSLPGDTFTLGPAGQPAWSASASYPMRYKTQVTLAAKAKSGGTVALSVSGPCTLTGTTVTATAGAGTCTLTARSPGTSSLSPVTQAYTIVLARGMQMATLSAPAPPSLRLGVVYRLANPGTVTSAGIAVGWRVSYGKKRCRVLLQPDGSYALRAERPGRCNVRAYAAPVPGQWLKFKKLYKYRVSR